MLVVNVFSARVREMVGPLGACHSLGLCRRCSRYFAPQTVCGFLVAPRGPERKFLIKAARADANCLGLFGIRFVADRCLAVEERPVLSVSVVDTMMSHTVLAV